MRVISGMASGLKLKTPGGMKTRPTTDRVKETLFNIIQNDIEDVVFLDLFSGSGSLGIEALSRGARRGVFIDKSYESIGIINENIAHTGFSAQAKVYKTDFRSAIKMLGAATETFNLFFLDPPYLKGYVQASIQGIISEKIVATGGLFVIERSQAEAFDGSMLRVFREVNFGQTVITFAKYEA